MLVTPLPIARVNVYNPYLSCTVEALCLLDVLYDVIIGNVLGQRALIKTDSDIHTAAVVTRAQAKLKETTTHLTVPKASPLLTLGKEQLEEIRIRTVHLRNTDIW